MNKWVFRILVHFVSVLIAMPFGWCCWLPSVPAKEVKQPAENCCCSHAKQAPTPAPVKPTEEKPEPPSCCCDVQPFAIVTQVLDGTDQKPIASLAVLPAFVNEADIELGAGEITVRFPPPKSPPLHLLHCVWLC